MTGEAFLLVKFSFCEVQCLVVWEYVLSVLEYVKGAQMHPGKSELYKSVVMAWVDSPAQSQMSLFLEYPFPRKSVIMSLKKNIAEAVTRDGGPLLVSRANECI